MKKLESNFLSFHLYYYLLKIFCQIRGSRIQKMTVKGFSITLWVQKMMVKGFSITLWIQKMMVKGFSIIFWRPFVCSSLTSFFNMFMLCFLCNNLTIFCVFNVSSGMSLQSVGHGGNRIYWPAALVLEKSSSSAIES